MVSRGLSSMPYPGTIQDLTFNLFSTLADQHPTANALFWITVWITAVDLGPSSGDSISRFKLLGSRLVDAGPGVTVADCWIWIELGRGVGRRFGGICGSDLGRVMDG